MTNVRKLSACSIHEPAAIQATPFENWRSMDILDGCSGRSGFRLYIEEERGWRVHHPRIYRGVTRL